MSALPLFSTSGAPAAPLFTPSDPITTTPLVGDLSMGTKPKKPSPLLLSSALPPVPSKSLEKIQNGTYLDFKELLPDNISLLQNAQDLGGSSAASMANSKLREVPDPLSWVTCFLTFMAAKVDHQECRDLAAYAQIVIHLARKHGGKGWLAYDKLFRQQMAAGAESSWAELNSSLMAATVLATDSVAKPEGEQGGQLPPHCQIVCPF